MPITLDKTDLAILRILQNDASTPLDAIAKDVGASKTPVWNRIRKMRDAGIIRQNTMLLDADKLGLDTCFFVFIQTSQHEKDWLDRFLSAVGNRPEILEAHRLAGEIDYILKVRVADARAYDAFYQALISEVAIFKVTSTMSMQELKYTTQLPI